jgi:hypothetical protein
MNTLSIVCKDGSVSTIENVHLDRLGPVLEGLFEITSTPEINLGHLFHTSAITKPLESYFKGGDAFLDLVVDDKDDALAICYEAAFGELNLQKFVDMLEREVYTIIEDGTKYKKTALFSLPAMAAIKKIVFRSYAFCEYGKGILWTRAKLRSAAEKFDVVVMLTGFKRVTAVFNCERSMKNPNWIEWAMSTSDKRNDNKYDYDDDEYFTEFDCNNPEKTRELIKVLNPEGKKYMVFEDACAKQFFNRLSHADGGLWDIEYVFNNLLRYEDRWADDVDNRFKNIKSRSIFTCVDKLDNEFGNDVAAVVGFANGLQMLHARDAFWDEYVTSNDTYNLYYVNNDCW